MKIHHNVRNIVFLSLLLLGSCEKPEEPTISRDPVLLNNLYSSSIDTLRIETKKYFLTSYLHRDFMPMYSIKAKHPLTASVELIDFDSTEISTDLDISKLYVIDSNLIWISTPKAISQINYYYKILKVSIDGPEWETGIHVDVVAEILNTKTKNKSLLIKKHQYIERTE